MTADGVGAFISSCTNEICKGSDHRVKIIMNDWDRDRDGFLS